MAYKIYLVRHGQTILNRYNKMQGWCDSPLTPKGIEDGKMAGQHLKHLKFDYAFHSDTTRAQRTCGYILAENDHPTPQPLALENFREQGYGYFEGADSSQAWLMIGATHNCRTFKELITQYSIEEARDFCKEQDPFHQAENNQEFWNRLGQGFAYIAKIAQDQQNILVVSHGTTIRSIVHHFDPTVDITQSPKNGSVTRLTVDHDQISVDYFSHYLDNDLY
ncbi:probable phosphoglycerate mutase [Ligilactobacillus sp. WC1T17]|uniref:Probable phosphoglycerate mutase n=1 Tax=Ligilactobacillus ruminis TaxID=1623 RepID=A0ABY1ACM1_9LACO|nr:probable phosphoglycerate mutase [Ligilactobacillus ruminis]